MRGVRLTVFVKKTKSELKTSPIKLTVALTLRPLVKAKRAWSAPEVINVVDQPFTLGASRLAKGTIRPALAQSAVEYLNSFRPAAESKRAVSCRHCAERRRGRVER